MSHALLSPSSASRWLSCPPSARLEEPFPDNSGDAAREGTLCHTLGEAILRRYFQLISAVQFDALMSDIVKSEYYNADLQSYAEAYAAYVIERYSEARKTTKDAIIKIEAKLNLTDYIPEGFGTGDAVIIADGTMEITDLKYGKGVRVNCERNKQMMLYALGALREFDFMYAIDTVRMNIYQPRIDNISSWEISVEELELWATQELIPTAALAFAGEGNFTAGDHCRFCKARTQCRALAEENLKLAEYDFKDSHFLTDLEISDIMNRADMFKTWLSSVEEYALLSAINDGKKWPGYKLVEGRSVRLISDKDKAILSLQSNGVKEEVYLEKKLASITALEKLLSKTTFNALLGHLIIKPAGKPTLVPETDKRPEWNSVESAVADFQ